MKIPSKVKIFMWRALHGILPLKSILYNRHIGSTGGCPICNQGPEDISHLLFQCETARDLWNKLGIADLILEAEQVDRAGSSVLEELLRRQDNTLAGFSEIGLKELISVSCWYLWWIRRRRTHNEVVPPIYRCKMSILSITANALKASKPAGTTEARWSKPKPRHVKLNVDASFLEDRHAGAVRAVLRDFQGNFLAASCVFLPHVTNPLMAEAIAMREGLKLANEIRCNMVQAESDSTGVIDACKGEDRWWDENAAIYADCVDLVTSIGDVSFSHCPREANKVAHELAKFSFANDLSCNWVDEPPSFLIDKLISDVTEF
jgi:ribonuclease HI